jgi:exopolyphosphatase/guanosine-5'-triphosphate,3'-diphosphate pyrophosphatase
MPVIAAIDAGSNALRLVIGSVDQRRQPEIIEMTREPVRLGQDVFNNGLISDSTVDKIVCAFKRFQELVRNHQATLTRAVGTSALREAHNKDMVIELVHRTTGIQITPIGPEEEARLVHLAVARHMDINERKSLIVDIGGGSIEMSLSEGGQILSTECFMMGAVRLLQKLDSKKNAEQQFHKLVEEYAVTMNNRLKNIVSSFKVDTLVGIGGNIEALGGLRQQLLGKKGEDLLSVEDLELLLNIFKNIGYRERISQWGLRPDRADVIVPAAIVLKEILKCVKSGSLVIPRIGLKEGLLYDLIDELYMDSSVRTREQALMSAAQIGKKYKYDELHARTVTRFALEIFDATRELHNIDQEGRLLLELAAILHDIGQYVNINGHHKHSYYLITASPIVGVTPAAREIVANIARYHRKASPSFQHLNFRKLSVKDRTMMPKLAGILRLADAFDAEHAAIVREIKISGTRPKMRLKIDGEGDLLLVKWAISRKANLFEEVFGTKIMIEN